MIARRRIVARGRVQGVWFRDSTRRRARELGLSGWVGNRSDGAVEAVFEGAEEAVERMVEFCRAGPGDARVASLEVGEEPPEGLEGFAVR